MLGLRKKDKVLVLAGRDKGKSGEILSIDHQKMRVLIAKVNIVTRHKRARGTAEPGGLQKREAPIAYSNVQLLCPSCEKPTRPKADRLESGEKVRVCRRCGEKII